MDGVAGILVVATMICVTVFEWTGLATASYAAMAAMIAALALFSLHVPWSRRLFLLIGLALAGLAIATLPNWPDAVRAALRTATFIVGFFAALTSLRSAALTSEPINACGRFLAEQPPGRRYLALTVGGGMFGLVLSYGAISLLGTLAETSAQREPNAEIRGHRLRRMLVAIQRGFIATLPWSPLAFSMAISTSLVPGASWAGAVLPCLVSGLLLLGIGWTLDTIFKPKLTGPRPVVTPPDGHWSEELRPLLILLGVIVSATTVLHLASGVRIVGVVMAVVPVIALLWIGEQDILDHHPNVLKDVGRRASTYARSELPRNRSEIVLLAMAGFIGTLGAALFDPVVRWIGLDLSGLPPPVLLLAIFWLIPITGQFGMNPILAASLFVPLLPTPEALGIDPAAVILAITSGWALSGATSPFTASTLLIAFLGKVSALRVGLRWNGAYALICGVAMSAWICLAMRIL